MIELTATVITFNEEGNIRECLESLNWVSTIIVVDSGSTDRTVEIALEYTDEVHVTDWPGHVEQKNRAISLAKTDWIISLDADERVSAELRDEIIQNLQTEPEVPGFSMPRRTWHLGQWIRNSGWYPDRKIRVFNRHKAHWAGMNPHDRISIQGAPKKLKGDLLHYSFRDLHHHIEGMDFFTSISAKEMDRHGGRSPLLGMLLRAPWKFFRMLVLQTGYRDGFVGFILAGLGMIYVFLKYACLWERRRLKRRGLDPDSQPRNHRGPEWKPPRKLPPSLAKSGGDR